MLLLVGVSWRSPRGAVQGREFRTELAIAAMVVHSLAGLTGGTAFTRAADNDTQAFLGWGPDREEPDTDPGLTGIGVFLFVSLPLFLGDLALLSSG